jgi:hypothetical protein
MNKKKPTRVKHVPQRTCIVCRQKTDKRCLTRIVRTQTARVVVDSTGKQNGRGAYICNQPACWDKIIHTDLLNQALKGSISAEEKAGLAAYHPQRRTESQVA